MKPIILTLFIALIAACGDVQETPPGMADPSTPTASEAAFLERVRVDLAKPQPSPVLTTTYHAWNSITVLDWDRGWDSMCAVTYYASLNGHLGSPTWSGGIPRIGSEASFWFSGVNRTHFGPAPELRAKRIAHQDAHVFASATCWPFDAFEQLGVPVPWQIDHFDPNGPRPYFEADHNVSGSINWTKTAADGLWTGNSFSYLSGFGGLSTSNESASVYKFTNSNVVGGYEWRLNVTGRGAILGVINQVYFGRAFNDYGGMVVTAGPGQDANTGVHYTHGACVPTYVGGDVDGGSGGAGYEIYIASDSKWHVRTWGGVTAKVRCVSFFAP